MYFKIFFSISLIFISTLFLKVNGVNRNVIIGDPYAESAEALSNLCRQKKQCGLCHQQQHCVWCKDSRYILDANAGPYDRCNTIVGHEREGCTQFEERGNPEATSGSGPSRGDIEPSEYDVRLWVEQKVNITFRYKDSGNKPLDLYYLMDLSQTMEDDKDAVVELGRYFARALQNTTSNLKMGFGSFVDKPVMPFAAYSHIKNPGPSRRPVYGFENQLSLTLINPKIPTFETKVKEAQISVNLDAPEGGLDAMMQVMECKDEIGWRTNAHRIMVVSTDGSFHIAGDGKLGGIVLPNDGRCHMENHLYTGTTEYDYPSIAQVVAKIRERQIYVIFAVQKEVETLYKTLSALVSEYASTIRLDAKSTAVGQLVQNQYEKIRSTVELSSNPVVKESDLGMTYYVKCSKSGDFVKENKCTNLVPNAIVEFRVEFELKRCPSEYSDREWTQVLRITPTGSEESLRVNLHLKCGCGCEEGGEGSGNVPSCSGKGSIECGICKCNEGLTGERCQCDRSVSSSDDPTKCLKPCGGLRGTCKCGECVCNEPFSGPYCDCDKRKCPCFADSHGRCECEKCTCDPGWSDAPSSIASPERSACSCSAAKDGCFKNGDTEMCGGRGDCVCNRCICESGFVGKFCDVCQSCECLDDFVRCFVERENKTHVHLAKGKDENEIFNCTRAIASNVNITHFYPNISIVNEEKKEKKCFPDFEGCNLEYIFGYDKIDQTIEVRVRRRLDCPIPPRPTNPLPIIFGIIASVVVLGILTLLLWKIITYLVDKHEFNKFEKDCQERKWETSGNPLYKEATSTFQNPAYTD